MRHFRETAAGLLGAALALATPAAAEDTTIHVVLPLTGGASFLGKAGQKGLEVAEKTVADSGGIHGRKLKFVFHDDQTKPQVAVQTINQILATRPKVILGSALVATCNAMAPALRRATVMYCLSPGVRPAAGDFMFTSSSSTADLAAAQIRYWRSRGITKLALITSTDASGQDAVRNIREVLAQAENADVKLAAEVTFNPGDVSVAAQIQRIAAAEPQAIVAWSTGAAIGTVFKGIVDAGLDLPVATTDGNMTYEQMAQYASILPKQLYIPSPLWPRHAGVKLPEGVEAAQKTFFAAFDAAGVKPDIAAALSWDPAMLIVHALRTLPDGASAEQVRAFLADLQGHALTSGIYDFRKVPQRGLDDTSVVVTRWEPTKQTWDVISRPRGLPLD